MIVYSYCILCLCGGLLLVSTWCEIIYRKDTQPTSVHEVDQLIHSSVIIFLTYSSLHTRIYLYVHVYVCTYLGLMYSEMMRGMIFGCSLQSPFKNLFRKMIIIIIMDYSFYINTCSAVWWMFYLFANVSLRIFHIYLAYLGNSLR